jgi:hypothetical protein
MQEPQLPPYITGMINLMSPRRRLAALIWAAIFSIAAQFVAGSASAHSGQSHDHTADSHFSSAAPLPHDGNATEQEQLIRSEKTELSASTPEGAVLPASPGSGGCIGGCCGNGIACCGAVLASCSNCLPDFRTQTEIVSLAFEYRSGIDPEPLRRPPRTLA